MQRLICAAVMAACCSAAAPATAQFRDRDFGRSRDRVGDRYDGERRERRAERRVESYVFGERAHIPRLAADLYRQANGICWEMHRDDRHNRGYSQTYREMYEVRKAARHIEQLAKENYYRRKHNDDHITRDLHEMDKWVHHVEADVRRWRPDSPGAHRNGDLHTKLDRLEETLHHMMDDYGVKSRIDRISRRRVSHSHDDHDHGTPRRYRN